MQVKSSHPRDRLGVFKRYEDVPEKYRLDQHNSTYAGSDVWGEFVSSRKAKYDSTHYWSTFQKAGESWCSHMRGCSRHHALARPQDVEAWYTILVRTRTYGTVHSEYAYRLIEFYDWLQWHTDHPHTYHPPIQAALSYSTARRVWEAGYGPVGENDE
jgi:hypothetical protein